METAIIATNGTNGMQNEYLNLVKTQTSEGMLDIKGFVTETGYNIDPLIIDEQWNMLNAQRPDELIVLSAQMLQRLNFCRTPTLIKKLEQLFPAPRGDNDEYWGDGANVSITIAVPDGTAKKGRGGHNCKQIKMTKGAYKQLLMETQTDAAKQVRKYYICLEELFVQYLLYQCAFELTKADRTLKAMATENKFLAGKLDVVIAQNREVIAQNEGLAKQNEGIARQNEGLARQNDSLGKQLDTLSWILYVETNNKVVDVQSTRKQQELVVMQDKVDPESCVILRGQKMHVQAQMKRCQDQMNVIGTVESYRNPINLYNRFSEQTKRQKDERFEVTHNKVTLKNGTTPIELLECFNTLNEQKFSVANEVKKAL